MQAAIYQKTGVDIHLKRRQLEELFRKAACQVRKQFWQKEGTLWWFTFLVRPRMLQWPAIPTAASFRMMFWLGDSSLGMVQRCVDPVHEVVQGLDVQALCSARVVLILSSTLWMLMDPIEKGLGPPLLAATHKHRPIRGGVKTPDRWVSVASFSAAYPPAMCRILQSTVTIVSRVRPEELW